MKRAYPIIAKSDADGFYVVIPDFDSGTQGKDLVDAIEMARDAIGLMGITWEDMGKELPEPDSAEKDLEDGDIVTYVDVDFVDYRRKYEKRSVKKNCTIPYWMSVQADKAHLNYSKVLQDAIANLLDISYT